MPKVATFTATVLVESVDPAKRSLKLTVWPLTLNLALEAPPRPAPMMTRVLPSPVAAAASFPDFASCATALASAHADRTANAARANPLIVPPSRDRALIQRLELDDRRAMVAADPERHGRGRVVDEHAPDIGFSRQQVVDH